MIIPMQELQAGIKAAAKKLFDTDVEPELTRPEEKFGDYATNVALQLAKKLSKNPQEVAEALAAEAGKIPGVAQAVVAGPGFLNLKLTDEKLAESVQKATNLAQTYAEQEIVLEHTDPNPFKEFHIGHAYSNTVGVAVGKILQAGGAKVHQVTYQGDVGLHIAMAVWAIGQELNWQTDNLNAQSLREKIGAHIGDYYARGSKAYQDNPKAKKRIEEINQQLYKHDDKTVSAIYDAGRAASLSHFEYIYDRLGARFEKNYFESDTAEDGVGVVKKNTGKIFTKSQGAVIYDGEKVGLHKRVFITKAGLPTYEAKEIGLAFAKQKDYPQANSFIVITANEIDDYFKVLVAAINEIDKKLAAKIRHLSHGVVRFPGGKMSSRSGNVKLFSELETDIQNSMERIYGQSKIELSATLSAIKYEFLKHRVGSDFIFDVDESISLQGNSGPYLQYAHARAASILKKVDVRQQTEDSSIKFELGERSLARKISEYPEVVAKATEELMPHHITTYLYELAQNFNSFYEQNRVVDDPRQTVRLTLVQAYANVLKNGLSLLNIDAPDKV